MYDGYTLDNKKYVLEGDLRREERNEANILGRAVPSTRAGPAYPAANSVRDFELNSPIQNPVRDLDAPNPKFCSRIGNPKPRSRFRAHR